MGMGVVVPSCNPSSWKAEAGRALSSRPAWLKEGHSRMAGVTYRETLPKKKNKEEEEEKEGRKEEKQKKPSQWYFGGHLQRRASLYRQEQKNCCLSLRWEGPLD